MTDWLDEIEPGAPDAVAAFRGIEAGKFISVRREVRRRAGPGSAERVVAQLGAIAQALVAIVEALPEPAFAAPGGEGDWNVAEAIGHDADSRAGLAMAGALAATGKFPPEAPSVVPGIPGTRGLGREALVRRLGASQRIVERAGRSIAGHEEEPCPLEHPQVGRLRCGEWLLFAAVHDLMHLEQLHGIAEALRSEPGGGQPGASRRDGAEPGGSEPGGSEMGAREALRGEHGGGEPA
ncbi:MAG: DinB family protein [Chloroflexota bacterium]